MQEKHKVHLRMKGILVLRFFTKIQKRQGIKGGIIYLYTQYFSSVNQGNEIKEISEMF